MSSKEPLFQDSLFEDADYKTIASAMVGTVKFDMLELEQQMALRKFTAKKAKQGA